MRAYYVDILSAKLSTLVICTMTSFPSQLSNCHTYIGSLSRGTLSSPFRYLFASIFQSRRSSCDARRTFDAANRNTINAWYNVAKPETNSFGCTKLFSVLLASCHCSPHTIVRYYIPSLCPCFANYAYPRLRSNIVDIRVYSFHTCFIRAYMFHTTRFSRPHRSIASHSTNSGYREQRDRSASLWIIIKRADFSGIAVVVVHRSCTQ